MADPCRESNVLNLALTWLKFDENRQQYTKKVMKKVHLGLLPRERLVALLTDVEESPECKNLICDVLKLLDSKDDISVPLSMSHPQWFSPRKEMVINALIGIGPARYGGQSLVYFNAFGPEESLGWQHWCEFECIPHDVPVYDSSVTSIDGKLYIAGGICKPGKREYRVTHRGRLEYIFKWNSWFFHEGNIGEPSMNMGEDGDFATINIVNPWTTLPELKTIRNSFPMVYLDGYLYAIGGEDEDYCAIKDVDRYSFKDKTWEKITDLPVPCYYASATVYKGKILVYGSQPVPDSDTLAEHNLQMYDPATKQWKTLLTEHHKVEKFKKEISDDANANHKPSRYIDDYEYDSDAERADWADDAKNREKERLLPRNAIVVDREDCFRVVYPAEGSIKLKPLVHKLEFDFQGDTPSCNVGESQDQQLMPTTGEGAFQIRSNVYVNMKGVVHNTGMKISSEQTTEVDLGVWKKLQGEEFLEKLSFAKLTFDKKKIFCENCVRGKKCVNGMEFMDDNELMAMMQSDSD
ncbi:uncharacterized protein [Amphiura filiformis]|uniref:uncharacterized protein n=1 Tax=Amphiura filiformis TaxID=82378 RepID=UPI003B21F59B